MKINELITYINTQQNKCNEAYNNLQRTSTMTSIKDVSTGTKEVMTAYTPEDFSKALVDYTKCQENLRRAKVGLIKANNSTIIYQDIYTIQAAIIAIKTIRNEISALQTIVDKQPFKQRKCDGNGSSYYQIMDLNFEPENIRIKIESLIAMVDDMENAITKANTEIDVSIDFIE